MPRPFDQIPAPDPMPILGWRGNVLDITHDPLSYISRLRDRYGNLAALVKGGNPAILFPEPACPGTVFAFGVDHNHTLMSQTEIFHSGPIIGPAYGTWMEDDDKAVLRRVGTGLFSLNGEVHQRHRRLLQPAFHKKQIDHYAEVIVSLTDRLIGEWKEDEFHDIQREMFHHTLTVAGVTLFGQDFGPEAIEIGALIQEWLQLIPIVSIDPTDAPDMPYRRFLEVCRKIDQRIAEIISHKRKQSSGENDALSTLIHVRDEDGGALTEDDLIGHVNILLTAGHETTANAISWTLFLLTQHPSIMGAVNEEIDGALRSEAPTPDAIRGMSLLDRVVKESMRIFPPVTMGSRLVAVDTVLDDYLLPAGTEIAFSHYHTHHDPSIYERVQSFVPDRWLNLTPSPYEYFPFSTGVKMCLGAPFALMEIKIVLTMILQRFRVEFASGHPINRHVYVPLRPNAMPIYLRAKDGHYDRGVGNVRGNVLEMVDLPS